MTGLEMGFQVEDIFKSLGAWAAKQLARLFVNVDGLDVGVEVVALRQPCGANFANVIPSVVVNSVNVFL